MTFTVTKPSVSIKEDGLIVTVISRGTVCIDQYDLFKIMLSLASSL